MALVKYGAIPVEPMGFQLPENGCRSAGLFSWRIDIFDADEPLATLGSGVEKAGDGRQDGAKVKEARRRGCETADVAAGHWLFDGFFDCGNSGRSAC